MNPILSLILANLIWGAASPVFKYTLQNMPPFTLAFIRFFFAAPFVAYSAFMIWKKLSVKQWLKVVIGAFFAVTVNIGFFFLGLEKTQSINAPIIASSQPVFLYIFSLLFLKEKPHARVWKGILISFFGVMVIIISPLFMNHGITMMMKETAFIGNVFLMLATLGAVINALIFKKVLKEVNHYQVTFISFMVGALSFFPIMMGELQTWSFSYLNMHGWVGILFGTLLSSAVAYSLFNYGISKIPAQEVGIFSYIDPVVAVLLAMPLVHEYPTVFFFIGSFFVFIGILIAEGRLHYHPFHKLKNS